MKKLLLLVIIAAILLAGIGTVSAATNLVQNGGFESPGTFTGLWQNLNSGLTPWNIGPGNIDLIYNISGASGYWRSASGNYSIDLAGSAPGTISQVLSTTPSAKYDLSFSMSGNPDGVPTTKKVEVFWGGISQGNFTFNTTGHTHATMGWIKQIKTGLVATGSTTELMFVDRSGSDFFGSALDDIVVEQETVVPTPEFPTMALPAALIVGLLGAVLFIRKSKDN